MFLDINLDLNHRFTYKAHKRTDNMHSAYYKARSGGGESKNRNILINYILCLFVND